MAYAATTRVTHRENIRTARNLEVDGTANVSLPLKVGGVRTFRGADAASSIATAGAGTYTAAHLLSGTIVRDCAGASRADTLSTAALLVAAVNAIWTAEVGDMIECLVINGSDPTTEIITITAPADASFDANQTAVSRTILGTSSKLLRLRLTNVSSGTEAYVIYS